MNRNAVPGDDPAAVFVSLSGVPMLLLNDDLTVGAASDSFCTVFGIRPELVSERELSELGGGEWDLPSLISLLRGVIAGYSRIDTYDTDLHPRGSEARRIAVKVVRLPKGGDVGSCRLLVTIVDRTDLQALSRENERLCSEIRLLRHQLDSRVANSLQIVASILMLGTQHVRAGQIDGPDDEQDRLATVEDLRIRLFSSADSEQIDMHSYLRELCASLAACMLPDRSRVVLETRIGDLVLAASQAISVGLMVTEMTANAIRHASFAPNHGQIVVSMSGTSERWCLSVKDNGYGARASHFQPGLGTGIVDALARHLGAAYAIASDGTGTTATVERADT